MDISAAILYEDQDLIIVNKPVEILSQGDKKANPSLQEFVSQYTGQDVFIVNRLDRPVSGAILYAKSGEQQKLLSQSTIIKKYTAVVHKTEGLKTGVLTHFHMKDGKRMKAYISDVPKAGYKEVSMNIIQKTPLDNYDIINIELLSGRFHQIRTQLAHIKAYIKGDIKYGARRKNENRGIMLHARELIIPDRDINVVAPYPDTLGMWALAE